MEQRRGGQRTAMREAADRLNAAMIVTGSVRTVGSQARITINLIDAASGCYLWSGSIDRKLDEHLRRSGRSRARSSASN